jgi:hypothetical protein
VGPSNLVTAILHIEIDMTRSRLVLLLLAPALVIAAIVLLMKEKQPSAVGAPPNAAQPETTSGTPTTSPARPIAPAQPSKAPETAPVLPPGVTVARPGGDPNAPIPAAPPDQRVIRDHRKDPNYVPPPIKITADGMNAATAAIRPAVASCLSSATTVQFTLTMSGGRAQIADPRLMDADRKPEDQACVAKALSGLSWSTPDKDGSTQVTMPLTSSSSSKN